MGTQTSVAEETAAAKIDSHEKMEMVDRISMLWNPPHGFDQFTADSLLPRRE
jgi:hypothetical protein